MERYAYLAYEQRQSVVSSPNNRNTYAVREAEHGKDVTHAYNGGEQVMNNIYDKQHTIEDLQMNLRRCLELLRILLLTPPLPQHAGPRRIFVWMRGLVRNVHDLVPQDFAISSQDVQRRQITQ